MKLTCYQKSRKEDTVIGTQFREIRNGMNRLLCKADDQTGVVETQGPHKASYVFTIPIGGTFTVTRDNIVSLVTRTATVFTVVDRTAA